MVSGRDELLSEIAREETRLAALQAEVEAARARLTGLREQLASSSVVQFPVQPEIAAVPATNAAKVALFRSLFRGRPEGGVA